MNLPLLLLTLTNQAVYYEVVDFSLISNPNVSKHRPSTPHLLPQIEEIKFEDKKLKIKTEGNNKEDEDDPLVSLDDLLEADEETVKQVPVSNSFRLRKGRAVGFCFGEQGEGWVRGIVKRGNNGGENSVRFQGVVVTCWVSVDGELFSLDLRKEKYLTEAEPMEEGAWVFIEKCGDGCL